MTAHSAEPPRTRPAADVASVVVAALAIALAVVGLAYLPALLAPAGAVLALIAAGLSPRWRLFAGAAVAVAAFAWVAGMTIAVLTGNRLY
jgi:hypothetical protein